MKLGSTRKTQKFQKWISRKICNNPGSPCPSRTTNPDISRLQHELCTSKPYIGQMNLSRTGQLGHQNLTKKKHQQHKTRFDVAALQLTFTAGLRPNIKQISSPPLPTHMKSINRTEPRSAKRGVRGVIGVCVCKGSKICNS